MRLRGEDRYERLAGPPLAVLGLVFLAVYALPILKPDLSPSYQTACYTISLVVWIVFVVDYLARLAMARDRLQFVRRYWLDLLIIALPMMRPLRAVRGLVGLRAISHGGSPFTRRHVVEAVAATVAAGGLVGALAILDAERASPNANIKTFGDALWWALSTMTTVGYGDRYPITGEGRLVAAALMVGGVALLGVITASLASWFVERIGQATRIEQETLVAVRALRGELDAIRQELRAAKNPHTPGARTSSENHTADGGPTPGAPPEPPTQADVSHVDVGGDATRQPQDW
jgi:voltage-gated potassium channel